MRGLEQMSRNERAVFFSGWPREILFCSSAVLMGSFRDDRGV